MFTTFRELEVWQRSMQLVDEVYELLPRFPKFEYYILLPHLLRSAISIPSNIAEGHGRSPRGDHLHHLSIARGSLAELETQLEIAVRRHYLSQNDLARPFESSAVVGRMLYRLIAALRKKER
jgi:four helix bundle protein